MPELDGREMMKRLRETNVYGKKVPIVILTNLDADEKITWAVAKDGPAYYLIKSNVDMDEIVEKVNQAMSEKMAIT